MTPREGQIRGETVDGLIIFKPLSENHNYLFKPSWIENVELRRINMVDLSATFGTFENFEKVIEIINPVHDLPIVLCTGLAESEWRSGLFKDGKFRYLLIKLTEERVLVTPFKKSMPETAVVGKHWERASYLVRFSSGTHLAIAGFVMKELRKRVPGCKLGLYQSRHGEPAKIAETDKIVGDYATIVGGGFVKVDSEKKEIAIYGRSRAFTTRYEEQKKYQLGMTGHEFVKKMIQPDLPERWSIVVVNNDAEASIPMDGGYEIIPEP